jgi:hypothetical protein
VKSHGRGIVGAKEEIRIPVLKMERKPPKANLFDDLGVSEDMAMLLSEDRHLVHFQVMKYRSIEAECDKATRASKSLHSPA